MTLLEARITFTRCMGALLCEAYRIGIPLILDEVERTEMMANWYATHCRAIVKGKRCELPIDNHPQSIGHRFRAIGIKQSVHRLGLAADAYVIVDEKISNDRKKYEVLATFWKGLDPNLRWGGDFEGFPDLGHFSHEWEGRK